MEGMIGSRLSFTGEVKTGEDLRHPIKRFALLKLANRNRGPANDKRQIISGINPSGEEWPGQGSKNEYGCYKQPGKQVSLGMVRLIFSLIIWKGHLKYRNGDTVSLTNISNQSYSNVE